MVELERKEESMKIASWNIGAAHTINSTDVFDYDKENIDYFAQNLADVDADLIFLQETHMPKNKDGGSSLAKKLADRIGYKYFYDTVRAPVSFIDNNYQFGLSVISREPLDDFRALKLPDVDLPLHISGRPDAKMYAQYLQIAKWRDINIFNTHFSPMQNTRESWSSKIGQKFASRIDKFLANNLCTPMIFAGDFNAQQLFQEFPEFNKKFALSDALPAGEATSLDGKVDYLLYSPEFDLVESEIIKTDLADHDLLIAEFKE